MSPAAPLQRGANHRPRSSPALLFPRPLLRRENLPEWLAELRETFACVLSIYYERLRGRHMGGAGDEMHGAGVRGGHTSRPAPPRGHQPGSAPHGTGKGVRVLAKCNPQPPSPPLPGGQGLGLKVPALQSHVVFLVISPILTLPRDPKLSHLLIVGAGLLKKGLLMNSKRYFRHSGNVKGFRSSAPGTGDRDQMCFLLRT